METKKIIDKYIQELIMNYVGINSAKHEKSNDFKVLYSLFFTMFTNEMGKITEEPDIFKEIASSSVLGFIRCGNETIDFSKFVQKEPSNFQTFFYLIQAFFILQEYLECKNLYKATINQCKNATIYVQKIYHFFEGKVGMNLTPEFSQYFYTGIKSKINDLIRIIRHPDNSIK